MSKPEPGAQYSQTRTEIHSDQRSRGTRVRPFLYLVIPDDLGRGWIDGTELQKLAGIFLKLRRCGCCDRSGVTVSS